MPLTTEQIAVLMRPINGSRVESRKQGGKNLSYLASYDVRAHLIRIFGFGNFDVEVLDTRHVVDRSYVSKSGDTEMVECIWHATVRLRIRDLDGEHVATYTESAVGATSGPSHMLGEHHDNAVKTAASDALKRCAINLGSQFGLSLYADGSRNEVVRNLVHDPRPDVSPEKAEITAEQEAMLAASLGATPVADEEPNPDHTED